MTESTRDSTPRTDLGWDEAHERNEEIRARHYGEGDYTGWFEGVYAASEGQAREVPWARLTPNPLFISWADRCGLNGAGERALVVGCGLGDDAEELARRGFSVTAFDISPSAIEWCRRRFPDSRVEYRVADLFQVPPEWRESYSFVLEVSTLQSLPEPLRPAALVAMADCVAPGGSLLLVAFARMPGEEAGEITPWPLLREELSPLQGEGLEEIRFEILTVKSRSRSPKRFRVEYRKPDRQP